MLIRLICTAVFTLALAGLGATAAAAHDGDGGSATANDATSYPAVVRGNVWYLREGLSSGTAHRSFRYGRSTDIPVFGDWDGDGTATAGVYRDGTFFLTDDVGGGPADHRLEFGGAGDIPVVGDWTGDGADDVGFVRGNAWYLDHDLTGGGAEHTFRYGRATDTPFAGDWDGDGVATPGVVRGNTWYLSNDYGGHADIRFDYGRAGDDPIVGRWGDWDHDHVGVVRGNRWYLLHSFDGGAADHAFDYGSDDDWMATWGGSGSSVIQPEVHYLYTVGVRGEVHSDFDHFVSMVHETLNHRFSWSLARDIRYTRVRRGGHMRVWLASPREVDRASTTCSAEWSCSVGDDVYINDDNWRNNPDAWAHRSQHDYRHYVIVHEVGHWLGLDHRDCPSRGAPAPVMVQQSISTEGCETNVWPLGGELAEVRTRHVE